MVDTIVADTLDFHPASLRPDATLRSLGADDLDAEEILYFCEQAFGLAEGHLSKQINRRPAGLVIDDLYHLVDQVTQPCAG